ANCGVVIASHPSITGISTGSGLSGNTQWFNSVRAHAYLKTPSDKDSDDSNLRELEFKKNQYGPISQRIMLRWQNGLYLPAPSLSSSERPAADNKIDDLFLMVLDRFTKQNQIVTASSSSKDYAPKLFADHPDANGTTSKAFAKAMQRLLDAGKVRIIREED